MTERPIGKYIGIPWVTDGHSLEGCDCWGLFRLFYRNEYQINLPGLTSGEAMYGAWTKVDTPIVGDLLLFRTTEGPHVGIALSKTEMLHVDKCTTSRIENFKGLAWKNRLRRIYRHRQRNSA